MFYQEQIDSILRFGDVIKGFALSSVNIDESILMFQKREYPVDAGYSIDISIPTFCVILTPCCSISDKIISLTPLVKLRNTFFQNPYFRDDLTRINRIMQPKQVFLPDVWENMPPEDKEKRSMKGPGYAFYELFVYEEHKLFSEYIVNMKQKENIRTKYYMIDFRNIYKVNYEKIKNQENILPKCLQLSVYARDELREKISNYYSRKPDEDKILLES